MRHRNTLIWPRNAGNPISKDLNFTPSPPPPCKDLKPLSLKSCIRPRVRYNFGFPVGSCSCNAWQKCWRHFWKCMRNHVNKVFERRKEELNLQSTSPFSLHGMESHKRLLFAEIIFSFVMRGWVLLFTEGAFLFFSSLLKIKMAVIELFRNAILLVRHIFYYIYLKGEMLLYFVKGISEFTVVTVVIKSNIYLSLCSSPPFYKSRFGRLGSRKVFG